MTTHTLVSTGWHWQYGWLRRPDLDDANGYCYEEPDGDLVYTQSLRHRKALRLACWREEDTGETYLAMCHAPCKTHRLAR